MGDFVIAMPGFESFKMRLDPSFRPDQGILNIFGNNEIPEFETLAVMKQVVQPGDTVVDGGANVGFFTLVLATLVGPTGRVLAFEPGPENVHRLLANVGLNNFLNVEVREQALWWRPNPIEFYQCEQDSGQNTAWKFDGAPDPITVEAVALGQVIDGPVKLVKLDIEGSEEQALNGMFGLRPDFVICELNEPALKLAGASQESLRAHMRVRYYHTFGLHQHGALPLLIPPNTTLKADYLNLNVLFASIESVGKYWPVAEASWKDAVR